MNRRHDAAMFDILVYLFENFFHADAYPEPEQLALKLSAAGFEDEEISEALQWLDELQEVGTGKVRATVDLKAASGETEPKHAGAWVLSHEGQAVFVEARPGLGSVHVASAADGKIIKSFVPRPCAP